MRNEQIQVSVQHLSKGMYVCGLDRPWLSTPFPFQGFVIRGQRDIDELRAHCSYVYVDANRGVRPEVAYTDAIDFGSSRDLQRIDIKVAKIKVRPETYKPPRHLTREIKRADGVHRELTRAVSSVIDDLRVGKPADVMKARIAASQMIQSVIRHPDAFVWLIRLREQDSYSYGHSVRSAVTAIVFGRHLGLPEDELNDLALGTLLCDVGKARVSEDLLMKRDPLSMEELSEVQGHVDHSVEILRQTRGINERVLAIVESHHERFDGSGYPFGIEGDRIPLFGRIAGLVDTYDAMTSNRPHTDTRMTPAEAMEYLYDHRDILFQSQLVEEFIKSIGIYPTGTLVELSSGELAVIEAQNSGERLHPTVIRVVDANGKKMSRFKSLNIARHNRRGKGKTMPINIRRAVNPDEAGINVPAILDSKARQRSWWDLTLQRLAS